MFCPNCGNKSNETDAFCQNCGTNLNEIKNNQQILAENRASAQSSLTMTEQLAKKNPLKPLMRKIKNFILKHKGKIIIIVGILLVVIIGFMLFNKFYDFTKISWDEEVGDVHVSLTEPTTLSLNVIATDKEKNSITDITFEVSAGEIQTDGPTVQWTLPKEEGTFTITAKAPSGKKVTKDVEVIVLKNEPLGGLISEEVDDTVTDNDNDGLTNAIETERGTNLNSADTDKDGISDGYEINETKTDPLKKDTDGDEINDGDELDLGLDPLKVDSKGDGIKDSDRTLTYTINNDALGVELTIDGKGNIASSTIDVFSNSTFASIDGLLDKVYNFYTEGTLKSAVVKIKYDMKEIEEKGLTEDNLTLYYFNDESKALEAIPTIVDKEAKTITVTLSHFSRYVIGDKDAVITDTNTQIMFVIDNSVSMYSESQMIDAGYNSSTGAVGNDTNFKRLTLTNNMIDMFTGNYLFGVAEFSGDYINLINFTNNQSDAKKSVNSMESNWNSNASGTNIISALKSGINEFKTDDNNHYLILLTDGKNTEGSLSYYKSTIINSANDKSVKICVIGLGSEIDTEDLDEIAEATGCDYYNATDSSALDEIYSVVGSSINYNYVDTDDDNTTDGMIVANSGFIVTRDGFPFANFGNNKSEGGNCYGMAVFAMLYYMDQLPIALEAAHKWTIFNQFDASDGYDLSGTYFEDGNILYDYKIENEALSYLIEGQPSDFRDRIEDDTWMIKTEYYDELSSIGATFSIKDHPRKDLSFSKYQNPLLNIDNDTFNNAVSKDERQLFSAIYRLYIEQIDDNTSDLMGPDKMFEKLNESLNSGVPVILKINNSHAINAIRLIQDNEDANKFQIEVYDNNYPGEARYIEVSRSKYSKWQLDYYAWTNEYEYTFMYDSDNDGNMEKTNITLSYPNLEVKCGTNTECYTGSHPGHSGHSVGGEF